VVRLGRTADATTDGRHPAAAVLAATVVSLLLFAPAAAAAGPAAAPAPTTTFVPQELADAASAHPDQVFRVIVQGSSTTSWAGR
jgi:hypothetical protein